MTEEAPDQQPATPVGNTSTRTNPHHLTLPPSQASLTPFPPSCPVLVYVPSSSAPEIASNNSDSPCSGGGAAAAIATAATWTCNSGGGYIAKVDSIYIDLSSTIRDNFYRIRPMSSCASGDVDNVQPLPSVPQSMLRYAPNCPVTVAVSSLPLPTAMEPPRQDDDGVGSGGRIHAKVMFCCDVPLEDDDTINTYYMLDVPSAKSGRPADDGSGGSTCTRTSSRPGMQVTVPASALQYHRSNSEHSAEAICAVAASEPKEEEIAGDDGEDEEVAEANKGRDEKVDKKRNTGPEQREGRGQEQEGNRQRHVSEQQQQQRQHQEDIDVPVANAAPDGRAAAEMGQDTAAAVHRIPIDEDASLTSSPIQGAPPPPNSSSTCRPTDQVREKDDRKRPAGDDGSASTGAMSTLSPLAGRKRPHPTAVHAEESEEVVRRIDIPDKLDANKIKDTLVGPDFKINHRMQTKFNVSIYMLGLDGVIGSPPDGVITMEPFSKLGPISFKAEDKCMMIQGSERKVHDAAKVLIHMLVNKCYSGDDKDGLMRELRKVRQVRKKAESPIKHKAAKGPIASAAASPSGASEERPAKRPATNATIQSLRKDTGHSYEFGGTVQRGWSPAQNEGEFLHVNNRKPSPKPTAVAHAGVAASDPQGASYLHSSNDRPSSGHGGQRGDIAKLLVEAKDKQDSLPHLSRQPPNDPNHAQLRPNEGTRGNAPSYRSLAAEVGTTANPAGQNEDGPRALIMDGPLCEEDRWIIKVRSPIGETNLFAEFVCVGGKAKTALARRFGLSNFLIVSGNKEMPLHIAIQSRERASTLAAADYVAGTLHDRSKPVPADEPERIFEKCYWNGKARKWVLHFHLPCAEEEVAGVIIGPGGRRNEELRRNLSCFIGIEGGKMEKNPRLRQYPAHLSIRDGSRILVEEAGSYMSKMLHGIASRCRSNAHNKMHRPPEPQNHVRNAAYHQNRQQRQHHFQHHHHHQQQQIPAHHQNTTSRNPSRPILPPQAQPVGSGANAFWTTTLWPPVEQYPSCDFYNRIVGPHGSTQRAIEHRFGIEIKVWGQQGNQREPLHIVVNGWASRDVDAAAIHIADLLMPSDYDDG